MRLLGMIDAIKPFSPREVSKSSRLALFDSVSKKVNGIWGMDRLWAPWRARYIQNSASVPPDPDACFLCSAEQSESSLDEQNLLVLRGRNVLVVLNRYPYNNGHLLVAPRSHKGTLAELDPEELTEPIALIRSLVGVLDRMLKPQGYNIGLNLGKSAGAGLPGHLHWHVVPRWDGDTNFMPVLGDAKVIVESLQEFYRRLRLELDR